MSISFSYLLDHGPVLEGLGRTALAALSQQLHKPKAPDAPTPLPTLPTPELTATLPPRRKELVADYARHVGGDPGMYRTVLPPHLFPQWSFGLASQTLVGLPYPIAKVMNGGCRLEINAPMPSDEPILVRASLESVDDDGRRAVLCQRIISGTASSPDALVARLFAIVPLGKPEKGARGARSKERPRVPTDVRELARWRLRADAGLDFAKLTGDFNPVHWIPAYARAFGFRNTILHGFSTMARAYEGLLRGRFASTRTMKTFDVKFTRPLVLPARVGLYATDDAVYVGDAAAGPAYMMGTYETN
jgi:acyl dehydratase